MRNQTGAADTGAIKNRRKQWTTEDKATLHQLAATKTAVEIAELLGRTPDGVRGAAKNLGIQLRKSGENHHSARHDNATVQKVIELRQQGLYLDEISEQTGVPKGTISSILVGQIRVKETMKAGSK